VTATEPRAYFAAAPLQPARVPTLTQPEGVRQILERPPASRPSGWNMLTLDRAAIVEGTRLRVSNGDRKHLDLLADGTLVAIAAFDGFLSWGVDRIASNPKIHGLALVEFTYDFVALYTRILKQYLEPSPRAVGFEAGIDSAIFADGSGGERALYLPPGPIREFSSPLRPGSYEAPASEFAHRFDVEVGDDGDLDVAAVAFDIVRAFYNWFGHTDDAIPYALHDRAGIDIDAIKAIG